jgi:hypothetical protein
VEHSLSWYYVNFREIYDGMVSMCEYENGPYNLPIDKPTSAMLKVF